MAKVLNFNQFFSVEDKVFTVDEMKNIIANDYIKSSSQDLLKEWLELDEKEDVLLNSEIFEAEGLKLTYTDEGELSEESIELLISEMEDDEVEEMLAEFTDEDFNEMLAEFTDEDLEEIMLEFSDEDMDEILSELKDEDYKEIVEDFTDEEIKELRTQLKFTEDEDLFEAGAKSRVLKAVVKQGKAAKKILKTQKDKVASKAKSVIKSAKDSKAGKKVKAKLLKTKMVKKKMGGKVTLTKKGKQAIKTAKTAGVVGAAGVGVGAAAATARAKKKNESLQESIENETNSEVILLLKEQKESLRFKIVKLKASLMESCETLIEEEFIYDTLDETVMESIDKKAEIITGILND